MSPLASLRTHKKSFKGNSIKTSLTAVWLTIGLFNKSSLKFGVLATILAAIFFISVFPCGCAIVRAPTGGKKDTIPPIPLGSIPKNYSRNFKGQRISILFNEFIRIKDQSISVQLSPEPEKAPLIKVVQKNIEVTFIAPLEKNRTYAINFGNSIVDYNEGNALKNYRFVFSTGKLIDSLRISGTVSDPLDSSVKKDVFVILHPVGNDSAIILRKPYLFTTTDEQGRFTLANLPEGRFNLYGLEESNKNKRYDSKSERIAFLKGPIYLRKDTTGVKLTLFREQENKLKLLKKTLQNGLLKLLFSLPPDSLSLTFLPSPKTTPYVYYRQGKSDTLYVWLASPQQDSIQVQVKAKGQKTLQVVQQNFNKPRKLSSFTTEDNIMGGVLSPKDPLVITFSRPLLVVPLLQIALSEDSIKTRPDSVIAVDPSLRQFRVYFPWVAKKKYSLRIKPGTITDLYDTKNLGYTHDFVYGEDRNYGTIHLQVRVPRPGSYLIDLLDERFRVTQTNRLHQSGLIDYRFVAPGKYRIRAVYDLNGNGRYDTGDLMHKRQPEPILNSKEITIRSNFEINPTFPLPENP